MVVRHCTRRQLRPWPRRCHHTERHASGLGICRVPASRNLHRAAGKHGIHGFSSTFQLTRVQSTILYSRFGNGIATNNLSKMLAGLILPERPIGNMYFAAWSHNVISNAVNLSNDLKMGEYRACQSLRLTELC